jgi:hypothetical protein
MFNTYSHVNFNPFPKKKSNKAWVVGGIDEKLMKERKGKNCWHVV